MSNLRVLHVASEVAPWAQTGGLADVAGALPTALTAADPSVRVAVLAPLYRAAAASLQRAGVRLDPLGSAHELQLGQHRVSAQLLVAPSSQMVWLDAPSLYDRDGLYSVGDVDFTDNHIRFAALGYAAATLHPLLLPGGANIVHAHDWQAGLAPTYLRLDDANKATASVMTIHNLAYRGLFEQNTVPDLGLPWTVFHHRKAEFWNQLSFLKAGIAYADAVTTVSPTYAQEIQRPATGDGLDGFLRTEISRVVGILNGIDTRIWDPENDGELAAKYSAKNLAGKKKCRAALAEEFGLAIDDSTLLVVAIARMSDQKGFDLVAEVIPDLYSLGVKLIVLGSGDPALEARFQYLAETFSQNLAVRIGFDTKLSHRMYAGADAFLMPSRFEPCGLGQLYAMRYGTVPIVRAVGGLRDTVTDADAGDSANGFVFDEAAAWALRQAIARASRCFIAEPSRWTRLRARGMARDSSWTASAREYLELYRSALRQRQFGALA